MTNNMVFFEKGDIDDPLASFKKLFAGICDPRGEAYNRDDEGDDATSVASTPSEEPLSRGLAISEEVSQVAFTPFPSEEEEPAKQPKMSEKKLKKEKLTEEKERGVPVLKATANPKNLRVRRGMEVFVITVLTVIGTLFALQRSGYEIDLGIDFKEDFGIDFKLMEEQFKDQCKLVEGQLKAEHKKWIEIVFKEKEVVVVPQKKVQIGTVPKEKVEEPVSETETTEEETVEDATTEDENAVADEVVAKIREL
jgi:hypothetical protein